MFFFLKLKESTIRPGTIEPDILPFSSSSAASASASENSTTCLVTSKATSSTTFHDYITTWDTSDSPALLRRLVCLGAFLLHVPLNIISILAHGLSLTLILAVIFSALNLLCLALALWKLDVMRGQRLFYHWMYVPPSLLLSLPLSLSIRYETHHTYHKMTRERETETPQKTCLLYTNTHTQPSQIQTS
jgi:hypothetical protein